MPFPRSLILALFLLFAFPASPAVLIVPADDEMIDRADAIVIARVAELNGAFDIGGDIVTNIDVVVVRVIKGELAAQQTIRLRELGGVVGTQAMFVSESATFWKDNQALLFLSQRADGSWSTWGASLGKFDFVRDADGRELTVRWATQASTSSLWTPEGLPHEEQFRETDRFLEYVGRRVGMKAAPRDKRPPRVHGATSPAEADYLVPPPKATSSPHGWDPETTAAYPPSAYTSGTFRWDVFDQGKSVSFYVSGTQPGYDSIGAAQRALAAWTNDPGSNVDYRYAGTNSRGFVSDGVNTIVYNSATDVPAGAIGYAKWMANAEHTYKGERFYSISEGDVVIRSNINVSQKVFEEAVTHEVGHTLGFRHSDQGVPSSTAAVMKAVLSGAYGSTLGPWDIEAVRTVYTSTATAPDVGTPANLVATATSATSIVVTWSAASNATEYELERATILGQFATRVRVTGRSFTDTAVSANTTYLYRVRAVAGSTSSTYSNIDHATTIGFADDPLIPGVTVIQAIHLTQLRIAVNAMRVAAALPPMSWTDPSPLGDSVKAVHITELRSGLAAALAALGKTASFTDTVARGTTVRAVHFQELRNLVK